MEDLLLRTTCACLEELTAIRRELRAVSQRVAALDEYVVKLDGTVLQGHGSAAPSRRPEGTPFAEEQEPRDLREVCSVQDRILHGIFMDACEAGQLGIELRVLAERAYSSFPGGKCAAADGWLQGVLVSEMRRGNLRVAAFQAVRSTAGASASTQAASRVSRVEDAEATVIKGLQGLDECKDVAVIFYPIFGRSCWQLLEAVLLWCRRERLTARMELAHGLMRSLLSDGDGLRDIDLLVLIRSAPLQTRAGVHLEEGGDVVLQSLLTVNDSTAASEPPLPHFREENHEEMIRRASADMSSDAEQLLAAEKAAASHLAELQVLGGPGETLKGVTDFDILTVVSLLRVQHFAEAAEIPDLLRSAVAGAVLWAYTARSGALRGEGQVEAALTAATETQMQLPSSQSTEQVAELAMEPASMAVEEIERMPELPQAQPPGMVGTISHLGDDESPHSAPPGIAEPSSPKQQPQPSSLVAEQPVSIPVGQMEQNVPPLDTATAAAAAIAAGTHGDQGESNSGSASEGDSPGRADDGWAPSTGSRSTSHLEQQAAFIKCFNDELVGQRPLLLSQLNNLYKMRSGEELNYKASGYEKLRDFLMDIPGLMLLGRGNRMQVRLSDANEFEAFQERLGRAEANTSHTPQFRMPKPLPESLQQRLLELFLNAEGHEILLKNFLNVWNCRYPTEQLAYRALGFRDVRGLLCNVPFLEKVGGKTDARYVLRCNDELQNMFLKGSQAESQATAPSMQQANGVQPISLAAQTSPGRMNPARYIPAQREGCTSPRQASLEPLSIDYFPGSGAKTAPATPMGRAFNGNPMLVRPRYDMQNLPPGRVDLQGHNSSSSGNIIQAQRMPGAGGCARPPQSTSTTPQAVGGGRVTSPMFSSSPLATSAIGVGVDLGITGTEPPVGDALSTGRLLYGAGNSSPTSVPSSSSLGGKNSPTFVPGAHLMNTVTKAQGSSQPSHSGTALVSPPPAHWSESPGFSDRAVTGTAPLTDGAPAHLSNKLLQNGRWVQNGRPSAEDSSPTRGAMRGFGGTPPTLSQSSLTGNLGLGGIHSLGSSSVFGSPDLELSSSLILPATVAEDRREDDSGNTESEGITSDANKRREAAFSEAKIDSEEGSISRAGAHRSGRRLDRKNKSASFFVSSPGAFSSETRDASIHQGKFDMCSVLQTQLRHGSPCLVCDISGGQVMVLNNECEDLFESVDLKRQLVQCDVFSLIHQDDRDKFSTFFAYLMVSERTRMEPFEIRIVTMLGHTRKVRAEGVQLIGVWWQLDFFRIDDADLSKDEEDS